MAVFCRLRTALLLCNVNIVVDGIYPNKWLHETHPGWFSWIFTFFAALVAVSHCRHIGWIFPILLRLHFFVAFQLTFIFSFYLFSIVITPQRIFKSRDPELFKARITWKITMTTAQADKKKLVVIPATNMIAFVWELDREWNVLVHKWGVSEFGSESFLCVTMIDTFNVARECGNMWTGHNQSAQRVRDGGFVRADNTAPTFTLFSRIITSHIR